MDETTIRITLELTVDGESLTGRVFSGTGPAKEVDGWLGLVAAIDALVCPSPNECGEAAASTARRKP